MACTIDETVGSASANSYCSIEFADDFHDTHVDGETWADLDEDVKCRALQQATREIDTYLVFDGYATTTTQRLAFPRTGLIDPNTAAEIAGTVVPDRVKWACSEQARLIAVRQRAVESDTTLDGISSIKAGPVEIAYTQTRPGETVVAQVVGPSAYQYIACWSSVGQAGRGGPVPLVRV